MIRKREREADTLWFMQKTTKALDTGLASLTKAPGALSRWVKAQGAFSRVLEAQAGEWARWVSALQRISWGDRERERERERKTRGPKLWWSKGSLLAEMKAYISLVRWLLSYYTGWNFINSLNMDSLIHTRSLTLKRVTACLIPWPQSWKLHAALLIPGIRTNKKQKILEK